MASVSSLRVAFCWVCCCSRMSCWFSSYLAALERSLYTYVYIVVNSFPAFLCPLFRMLFGHLLVAGVCCSPAKSCCFMLFMLLSIRFPPFYVHCSECYSVISLVAGVCCSPAKSCWFMLFMLLSIRFPPFYVHCPEWYSVISLVAGVCCSPATSC